MARWITVGLLILMFSTVVAGGYSAPRPSPFPLAEGNRWTLDGIDTNVTRIMSVRKQGQNLVLHGLPGARPLRVRSSGTTIQVWDTGNRRWEGLFRFGERAGESYLVRLGDTLLWRNVVVTVASKSARVTDDRGRTRRGTRFTFAAKAPIADAGLESMTFVPRLGPVEIVELTIAGPRELALASHRLR